MEIVEYKASLNRPENPLCSICVANYCGSKLLVDCLNSILRQDCGFDYEIIVHDDASTDDSLEILSSLYPQVEVLASKVNVGFCIANNRMVGHARGKYILLLNNDAALFEDALSCLSDEADRLKSGILTLPQYDWKSGELVDRGCTLDLFYNPTPNLNPKRDHVAMVIGACLWINKSEWTKLGGLPEWIESIGEDLYLCCAARLSGNHIKCLSRSGYRHRQGESFGGNRADQAGQLKTTYRRRQLSERNKLFAALVLTPTPIALLTIFPHVILLIIEGVFLALAKRELKVFKEIYLHALISAIKQRKLLLFERRKMQSTRLVTTGFYLSVFTLKPRKITMLLRYGVPAIK